MSEIVPKGFQKLEAHCHSYPISTCSSLEAGKLSALYKALGFKTIILTNHYRNGLKEADREETIDRYMWAYDREREIGRELGINVLFGAEITVEDYGVRPDGEIGHFHYDFLMYGATRDVFYKYYPFSQFSQIGLYQICQSHDILLIQAHPHRIANKPAMFNYMNGIEVYNGHFYSKDQIEKTYKEAQEHDLIMTCGTDCHDEGAQGDAYMMVPEEIETIEDFRDYLKTKPKPNFYNKILGRIDVENPPEQVEHLS